MSTLIDMPRRGEHRSSNTKQKKDTVVGTSYLLLNLRTSRVFLQLVQRRLDNLLVRTLLSLCLANCHLLQFLDPRALSFLLPPRLTSLHKLHKSIKYHLLSVLTLTVSRDPDESQLLVVLGRLQSLPEVCPIMWAECTTH